MNKTKSKLRYKKRKSLLYKSGVEYGDWCLNHIENCAHGCKFPCYAMMMAKRFGKIKTYADWLCPILVENSLELLDKEIPKYKKNIDFVHLCFMTDPFMCGYPEIEDMTLKIIGKLNQNDIKATVLTKGIFPIELTNANKYSQKNEYGITLVSLNEDFKKEFEPNTAKYNKRLDSLRKLHEAGLKTWISMEPYPTPNLDKKENLSKLLESVKFVDKIIFGKLNYNVVSSRYKGGMDFYNKCAEMVISFCKKHDIEYHIKFGTQKTDNKKTKVLFKKEKAKQLTCV
ncbi:radical SAM protein [Patescibacteria group bacterium]|nr:radical SAM protein [Patescibacteria group bacterium]MBU1683688.1 radical SAM protein [Patescibacteria group bacterium]